MPSLSPQLEDFLFENHVLYLPNFVSGVASQCWNECWLLLENSIMAQRGEIDVGKNMCFYLIPSPSVLKKIQKMCFFFSINGKRSILGKIS